MDQKAPPPPEGTKRIGIPEECQPLWRWWVGKKLESAEFNSSTLAKFEGYLAGNTPMTNEQMEAGCKVLQCFPAFKNSPKFSLLIRHLMDSLHERYTQGDKQEKDKTFWVARTLFYALYEESLLTNFSSMMGGIGDNHLGKVYQALDEGIREGLEKHKGGTPTTAFMHLTCNSRLLQTQAKILGTSSNELASLERRSIANPISLDTGNNGEPLFYDAPLNETPLDILAALQAHYHTLKRLEAITSQTLETLNFKKLGSTAKVLPYFLAQAQGREMPRLRQIAQETGLPEGTVKTALYYIRNSYGRIVESLKQGDHIGLQGINGDSTKFSVPDSHIPSQQESASHHSARNIMVDALPTPIPCTTKVASRHVSLATLGELPPSVLRNAALWPKEKELIFSCISLHLAGKEITGVRIAEMMQTYPSRIPPLKSSIATKLGLGVSEPTSFVQQHMERTTAPNEIRGK